MKLRVLIYLFLALILLVGTGIVLYKYKLSSYPVYKRASEAYVDLGKIVKNINKETVEVIPTSKRALLPGAKWVPQSFNNCVPATTSMLLQYFGYNVDQNTLKAILRTNADDKNVFTYEIHDYLKQNYNIESKLLYNGDIGIIKSLITNGFYVVIEDYLHPNDDIGHVTILRGFDDEQGVFIADDSYLGINIIYKYEELEEKQWKPFNREYLPVYVSDKEPLLKAIVGDDWDSEKMYQKAVEKNKADIDKNPNDSYALFNLGSSYFGLEQYQEAKEAFEKSRNLGWPKRMLWYQIQPIQTYNKLGAYQKAIELANLALGGNDSFAEAHVEKAIAYKGLGNKTLAKVEIEKALFYSANLKAAQDLLSSL